MVKIICDSAADLTSDEIEEYGLDIACLRVIGEGKEYKDGIDIKTHEVFENMEQGVVYTTSQVPVADFYEIFEKYAKEDQEFIYYGLSSGISGTYESSNIALTELKKSYPNVKAACIDSKSAALGAAYGVKYLLKAVEQGYSFEDICELALFLSENTTHTFTVSDLQFLYRGGRLSKSSMVVGNLLNIMPIINIDETGKLEVVEKSRGKNNAYKKIIEIVKGYVSDREHAEREELFIVYGKNESVARDLQNRLQQHIPQAEKFQLRGLGTVIGAHTGPFVTGVVCLKKDLPEKFKSLYEG